MIPTRTVLVWAGAACLWMGAAQAAVTPELQRLMRDNTFEVVLKKPEKDPVSYEKPLPLDLLPFTERTDKYRSVGTAFALGRNTYVTAGHVLAAAIDSQYGAPALRRPDGTIFEVDRILKFSLFEDFVVFSLRNDPNPSGFTVNREPKVDEEVLAVGNALGEGIVIRDGLFTSETPEDQDGRWKWIRFSAAASPGNSGGPLCDAHGAVIGIVIGKSPNENLNYSLPISKVEDAPAGKARFDQRSLVKVPYIHGGFTYSYKDEFGLPLAWPEFVHTFQRTVSHHYDEGAAGYRKSVADTLFPRGSGADDILFNPEANNDHPMLIAQGDDGVWTRERPYFHTVDLPEDGSVSAALVQSLQLVRIVRSAAASDDAFYSDSKGVMDITLKAVELGRPVGQERVRVTSLGPAVSDEVFIDPYGRKWQQRVWAVPFLDIYLVGMMLPTPDGYAAVFLYTPSIMRYAITQEARRVVSLIDVSYSGTLEQWQGMLRRKQLLPTPLSAIKLGKSPDWTLQTPGFASSVPDEVLNLTPKSLLDLTMGLARAGDQLHWDIQEVWWSTDNRRDAQVGLFRRAAPPADTNLQLRNRFESIRDRRVPFDGSVSRESTEVYSATSMIDVAGKSAGILASDLAYGVTLRTVGAPTGDFSRTLRKLVQATHVTETGAGSVKLAVKETTKDDLAWARSQLDEWEQHAAEPIKEMDEYAGKDVRGRHASEDLRDFIAYARKSLPASAQASSGLADYQADMLRRFNYLKDYWSLYPGLSHQQDLWTEFLKRNSLASDRPHALNVLDAERELQQELRSPTPEESWPTAAKKLYSAYIDERVRISKSLVGAIDEARLVPRSTPCPSPVTQLSGNVRPKLLGSDRDAEDFWPAASKRLGEEGIVITGIKVSETGCAAAKEILVSSGSGMLDKAALEFVETVRWQPATSGGKAVAATTPMMINFKLN